MMHPLPKKIWHEFQSAVAALSDGAPSREVLDLILFWIRANHKYLAVEPFSVYGFDDIAKIDGREAPVEHSSFNTSDLINFKNVISMRQFRDVEAIARFLRDTIEELATIESDKQCPRCESGGMRIFIGKHNAMLAYQCIVCGFSNYSDGSRVEAGGLNFASKSQLRNFGLI